MDRRDPVPQLTARPRARRGAAALMVLFVLIPLAALTFAFLQMGSAFSREHGYRIEDERALLLAEAGIEEGLFALRSGKTGRVGRPDQPAYFGDGLLWVESDTDAGADLIRLRSVAMVGSGRAAVERLVFHWFDDPSTIGIFSTKDLVLASNTNIDSFDSALGSYADQLAAAGGGPLGDRAVAQSNGDVIVNSTVEVFGDAHPGKDDTVQVPGSSTVTGSVQPAMEPRTLPPVTVPAIPVTGSGKLTVNSPRTLAPGDYHFTEVDLNSKSLTIQGPARIVVDDFDMDSNTLLTFETSGGRIEVYGTGDFIVSSNTVMQTTQKQAELVGIYFTGGPSQKVDLNSNADFYGTIYSPEGTVEIASNFEIFGSVAADQVILNSNVQLHFDEALLRVPTDLGNFLPATWVVVDFPVREYMADRKDPFELLGVDANALPRPGDAHDN